MLHKFTDEQPIDGLFVAAMYDNDTRMKLCDYIRDNNIPNPIAPNAMHTTIVHSRVMVEFEENHTLDVTIDTSHSKIEVWTNSRKQNVLVLLVEHPYLRERFEHARRAGAMSDYPMYNPHITLSYDIGTWDHSHLTIPNFDLRINCEYMEYLIYDLSTGK